MTPRFTKALAPIVALALAAATPLAVHAETTADLQAQLAEAAATLDDMNMQVAAAGEALNDTVYALEVTKQDIENTQKDIEVKTQELAQKRDVLSARVRASYTAGPVSLLDIVLSSSSFEELTSNIYYANKIEQQDMAAIAGVQDAQAALEEQQVSLEQLQSEQEGLIEQQQIQMAALEKQQAAQQAYVNGLSEQVRARLEAERQAELERQRQAAEAQRQAAEEEARRAAEAEAAAQASQDEQEPNTQEQDTTESPDPQTPEESPEPTPEPASPASPEEPTSPATPAPQTNSTPAIDRSGGARSTIVNAAYTQLGVPYVYGASSPGSCFDCSGFTMWCYSQAGVSIPHSSAGQSGSGSWISRSQLQPGDLVIWLGGVNSGSGNHVALYVGGGNIIHANGSYVKLDSLDGRSTPTCYVSVLG